MRYTLIPHPNHLPLRVRGIAVDLAGGRDDLRLTYNVEGAEQLVLPARQSPGRADDLWRSTCFELFLMPGDGSAYHEFNFSPSTQWAAYSFSGYRDGMTPLARDVPPHVKRRSDGVDVDCDLGGFPDVPLRMALTAVIEEEGGVKSFWALAHAPGAPDFHNPACFVATLPAPGAA